MTTNERMNLKRYKRFHTGRPGVYLSPYNLGWKLNLASFCGLTKRGDKEYK